MDRLIKQVNAIALADELAHKAMVSELVGTDMYDKVDELYEEEFRYKDYPQAIYDGYYELFMDIIYKHIEQ